jgi:hypothetical protein
LSLACLFVLLLAQAPIGALSFSAWKPCWTTHCRIQAMSPAFAVALPDGERVMTRGAFASEADALLQTMKPAALPTTEPASTLDAAH